MFASDFLNPILGPLLEATGPFGTIVLVSLFVSLLTTIVYKYTTNQPKLRKLKADLKRHQKKAQKLSKEDPAKALELQKEMMKMNGQYMKMSFRSTLYTFIPVILFFGWLSAMLSFAPLVPGQGFDFSVQVTEGTSGSVQLGLPEGFSANTNLTQPVETASWRLQAETPGEYTVLVRHLESEEEYTVPLTISDEQRSVQPTIVVNGVALEQISIGYQELDVFEGVFFFGSIPWVQNWGWLGGYILFSLLFSTVLRKLLKLA